jgi:hypothetical protein
MATPYEVLGVPTSADGRQIQTAFRTLAKLHHPDRRAGDGERFKQVTAAYHALKTEPRRRAYRLLLDARVRQEGGRPLATVAEVWANIAASLLLAFAAALCFVGGDRPEIYSSWLVGLGWALALLAWRVFADRLFKFRNPIFSLWDAALIVTLSGLLFLWRLATVMLLIGGAVGLLALAELALNRGP